MQSNFRNPVVVQLPLGSLSADKTIPAGVVPRGGKLISAHIQNGAAIAASDTNYAVIQVKDGSTVKCELDTRAAKENGLVQNVGKAMRVLDEDLVSGSSLTVVYDETDAGTNVALTDAVLTLCYWQKESA
jgi:hypothetical protein